ncbi:hypothetical protein [Soonwooa sp.]|uniref:hypothetical protein n=1 Tax=Soonwooa sp. TaxID=1938592 RepID=UPI00261C7725|nr:hypothetical protein [Soonwooa sp.]
MLLGFIPCLGAFNWINIPFSVIGLILSVVAYGKEDDQPKSNAMAGIIMCSIAMVLGFIRLIVGGGIV